LREPLRGQVDGIISPPTPNPFSNFLTELVTIIPPLTLIGAARRGTRALIINMLGALLIGGTAYTMFRVTGDVAQWIATGLGVYAVFSWAHSLKSRDAAAFALIWGTPTFLCTSLGYGLVSFQSYSTGFWAAPYAERVLGATKSEAGFWLGGPGALAGFLGAILGGLLADRLRKKHPAGRILMIMVPPVFAVVPFLMAMQTANAMLFYGLIFVATILTSSALGGAAATTQDLVLPRMRGTATATFFLATTLVGLSFGPYMAGTVSKLTGDLATGMMSVLAVAPISLALLIYAFRALPKAEASIVERARAAGEAI